MLRFYHYLTGEKSDQFKINDFWLTFSLLSLLGFLYGVISPLECELVEFGQIWAGKIDYISLNSWYQGRIGEITLQAIIPGFLLKLGISEKFLVILTSGIYISISFAAVGLLSYFFFRIPIVSFVLPLILSNYTFYDSHFYVIVFPLYFSVFGNAATFFTLLALMLFIFKKRKTAFFIIGFLPGLHIPWGLYTWIFAFAIAVFTKDKVFKKINLVYFSIGFISSITLIVIAFQVLNPDAGPIENPNKKKLIAYEVQFDAKPDIKVDKPKKIELKKEKTIKQEFKLQKRVNSIHNPLLRNSGNLIIKIFMFYSYDFLLLLFLTALFFYKNDFFTNEVRHFLLGLLIIFLMVTLYKVIDEAFLGYDFLNPIHKSLSPLIDRMIFNRWLNINTLAAVVLLISIPGYYAVKYKDKLSIVILLFILIYSLLVHIKIIPHYKTEGYSLEFKIVLFIIYHLIVTSGVLLIIYNNKLKKEKPSTGLSKNPGLIIILAFVFVYGIAFVIAQWNDNIVYKDDSNAKLFEIAKQNKGGMILPHFVQSFKGYNIQIRTRRPIYIFGGFNYIIEHPSGKKINLFCNEKINNIEFNGNLNWPILLERTMKDCLENISIDDWKYVGSKLYASNVITKTHFHLKLPVKAKSKDFILYEIPTLD